MLAEHLLVGVHQTGWRNLAPAVTCRGQVAASTYCSPIIVCPVVLITVAAQAPALAADDSALLPARLALPRQAAAAGGRGVIHSGADVVLKPLLYRASKKQTGATKKREAEVTPGTATSFKVVTASSLQYPCAASEAAESEGPPPGSL